MAKIICDVCGTSFSENATQCPICGCVRPSDVNSVELTNDNAEVSTSGTYTHVKGGRFSKANVKKRSHPPIITYDEEDYDTRSVKPAIAKKDTGLIIAICVLLLAIVAVSIFIVSRFIAPEKEPVDLNTPETTTEFVEPEEEQPGPCEDIFMEQQEATLLEVGAEHQIEVTTQPEETTDTITFESADETVATVTAEGKVVAVGKGQTTITIRCGDISKEFIVKCAFDDVDAETPSDTGEGDEDNSENNQEATEEDKQEEKPNNNVNNSSKYRISKTDVTLALDKDKSFKLKLYDANKNIIEVTWVAENNEICSIDGNLITGLKVGQTKVSVTYEGETFTCKVRVIASRG